MTFLIASTFTDSLTKLTGQEQKSVKQTAFDLQLDPTGKGKSFHKIDKSKDENFWSVRVTRDIRLIVHKTGKAFLLCYVDHHDDAYAWAERRRIERHPKTGAAQIVEVREVVREVDHYVEPEVAPRGPALFANHADEDLLALGVPADWLEDVKTADEDRLLELADHLPQEASEALLELAYGKAPEPAPPAPETADMFTHPDAQRRFRVLDNVDELERALDYPWEKWAVFLHPEQRQIAQRSFNGPARVAGSAGTGKTVVALHRAVHLAETYPDGRILLTTFSPALARSLKTKLRHLASNRPRLMERIDVSTLSEAAERLYSARHGKPRLTDDARVRKLLDAAAEAAGETRFTSAFLWSEWSDVVDAWSLGSWEAYRDVARLGRKTRLGVPQRESLWALFETVRGQLSESDEMTRAELFSALAEDYADGASVPYQHIVVDEAQDIAVAELRMLAAVAGETPDGLFFAGDLGQRIFRQPFSWKALGVDVRGRSHTLRVNYRTSHQIRARADRLLPTALSDVDGNTEDRTGTVSVFNGPSPIVDLFDSEADEIAGVSAWIAARLANGLLPTEIGLIVRSDTELARAVSAVEGADCKVTRLDDTIEPVTGTIPVATMHWAKGLEFRAVCVMACDDEVLPLQSRIEAIGDLADLQEVYDTERHLLYVACTRARDVLFVTGVDPASEFLDDLG